MQTPILKLQPIMLMALEKIDFAWLWLLHPSPVSWKRSLLIAFFFYVQMSTRLISSFITTSQMGAVSLG